MNWVTFNPSSLNALLAGALRLAASQSPLAFEDVLQVHTQREKGWGTQVSLVPCVLHREVATERKKKPVPGPG